MNRWSKLFLGLCYTSNGPSTVLPREGGEYETKKTEEHETETVCKEKVRRESDEEVMLS